MTSEVKAVTVGGVKATSEIDGLYLVWALEAARQGTSCSGSGLIVEWSFELKGSSEGLN